MAQDKQQEIINQLVFNLVDARETLRGLKEVADNPETIEAMMDTVSRIIDLFSGPDEDIGSARVALILAAVELSHKLMSEGIEY